MYDFIIDIFIAHNKRTRRARSDLNMHFTFRPSHFLQRTTTDDNKAVIPGVDAPCEAKKLHRFIFAIALSKRHLL